MDLKYISTYCNISEDLHCNTAKVYKIYFFSREANTIGVFWGFLLF